MILRLAERSFFQRCHHSRCSWIRIPSTDHIPFGATRSVLTFPLRGFQARPLSCAATSFRPMRTFPSSSTHGNCILSTFPSGHCNSFVTSDSPQRSAASQAGSRRNPNLVVDVKSLDQKTLGSLVYESPISRYLFNCRVGSITYGVGGSLLGPGLLLWLADAGLLGGGGGATVAIFVGYNVLLLSVICVVGFTHTQVRRHVLRLYYNADMERFAAVTFSFWALEVAQFFSLEEVISEKEKTLLSGSARETSASAGKGIGVDRGGKKKVNAGFNSFTVNDQQFLVYRPAFKDLTVYNSLFGEGTAPQRKDTSSS